MNTQLLFNHPSYVLLIDKSRCARNGEYSLSCTGSIKQFNEERLILWQDGCYPIIAHLPKTLDMVLITDIPLLPSPQPTDIDMVISASIGSNKQHDLISAHMKEYFTRWGSYQAKFTSLEWYHIFLDFLEKVDAENAPRKWTDEDMLAAYAQGTKDGRFHTSNETDDEYVNRNGKEFTKAHSFTKVSFIPDYETAIAPDGEQGTKTVTQVKTIINEQGIPVIQGKWQF